MNPNELREYLIDAQDYPASQVEDTINMVMQLTPQGQQATQKLMETGELPEIEAKGLSLAKMKRQRPEISDIALIAVFDGLVSKLP